MEAVQPLHQVEPITLGLLQKAKMVVEISSRPGHGDTPDADGRAQPGKVLQNVKLSPLNVRGLTGIAIEQARCERLTLR